MTEKKSTTQDIEKVLKEIGDKIEELVKKGADAGMDAKDEIEKKIKDLKDNKTTLEAEFKKGKEILEKEFKERTDDFKPNFQESKGLFKDGLKQIALAFQALFAKKK
ncbi:hypothetical protein LV84_00926 [Algoriphagus ratkowskyi]|uniref:Uncharacterized protein n=1 Tax=Algoriphagus ratkowskyi TaxID=57028 RepID=A0A2W7RX01_9BACT|nr:hypothetical protein [Algoriphagus ratkowskyi]PZX59717.1 hypothetical protein LV84_00926 [Algoriphagus ratkowskyi]TXD78567.1 hypothetical protein ESW18_07185 [Algoriphagus ratkowskyi]